MPCLTNNPCESEEHRFYDLTLNSILHFAVLKECFGSEVLEVFASQGPFFSTTVFIASFKKALVAGEIVIRGVCLNRLTRY